MEVFRECRECKQRWDGGLYDNICLRCKSKNVRIVWTDESNDPPDGYECLEDNENFY